jgi:hypothetical protein
MMIRSQKIKKGIHVIYFEKKIGNRISLPFEKYILLISLLIKIWMIKGFKKWCEKFKTLIPFQRDAIKDHEASNKHI